MYSLKLIAIAIILLTSFSVSAQTGQDSTKSTAVFTKVEVEAAYPGGNEAWTKYVQKNMSSKVPEKGAPVGKYQAIVMFVVSKDGSVSAAKAMTRFGYGMEDEVLRVVEASGKWTPAMQNGKPVNAYRKQPVTFIVDNPDFTILSAEPYTLYANTDNEVNISAKKVKAEDIGINVPGGKVIAAGNGKFIIKVNKLGRVNIELVNIKKDDATIGEANFEVIAK